MDLFVKIMNKKDTITSILYFQTDDTSVYWREPLFKTYPFLEKKYLHASWEDRKQYLTTELSKFYDKINKNLQSKKVVFQKIWNYKKENINNIYSKVFYIDCHNLFNNMIAEISLNPICPRDIRHQSYSVVWSGNGSDFLKTSLHEMIHFVWFYLWQHHFNDSWDEYEAPDLKWILSEMVVDTLVKNTDIGKLYHRTDEYPAYEYFYEMKIGHRFLLDELSSLYKNARNIIQFMEQAYQYCRDNEQAIRAQML